MSHRALPAACPALARATPVRHQTASSTSAGRVTLLRLAPLLIVALSACTAGRGAQLAPTFLEEFDGFPIYHGAPARDYEVLGPVYDASAARRGASPMKRAAVTAARALGADAVIVGVQFDEEGEPVAGDEEPPISLEAKWERAVAIRWR